MEKIARQMIENTHRLSANTYLLGHSTSDPTEHFEDHEITKEEEPGGSKEVRPEGGLYPSYTLLHRSRK